jgi:Uma2 family endonuclease
MSTVLTRTTSPSADATVPELQAGDRLTRAEFERRYAAMPHLKKAELVEGVVHMPSPVSHPEHARPHFHLVTWLGNYEMHTPGVEGGDNATVLLDLDNEPQPDALLRIRPECGGQSQDRGKYVSGAPELAAEVAGTSASYDLHDKLQAYRRNGVCEYVVWRVGDRAVDWFVLREGRYEGLTPDAAGCYRSEVFPGLWLDPAALLQGDLARVMAILQQGLATPEHAAFVQRLEQQRRPPAET